MQVKLISESDTPEYMPPKSLVFGSSPEALEEVVERATSFSCSLGSAMSKVIQPLLSTLPLVPREEQPLLFACENDHGAVATLKKQSHDRGQAELMQVNSLANIPDHAKKVISAFLAQGDELGDDGLTVSAPQANAYEFQSQGVVDMSPPIVFRE